MAESAFVSIPASSSFLGGGARNTPPQCDPLGHTAQMWPLGHNRRAICGRRRRCLTDSAARLPRAPLTIEFRFDSSFEVRQVFQRRTEVCAWHFAAMQLIGATCIVEQ